MLTPSIPIHQLGFVPDLAPNTPGAIVAMNGWIPTIAGMRTLPGLKLIVQPLPGILSVFLETTSAGAQFLFAGTVNHLYLRSGASWVENDGGQIFNAQPGRWRFAQFLDDCIATDGNAGDPGGGVQVSAAGGVFAPLGGNPPSGKYIAVTDPGGVAAVAFFFNTTQSPTSWYASSPGNDTGWTFNQQFQSATGQLQATPGPITGASNLRQNMVAFKASSFYLGTYVGGQFVWQFQPVSYQVGCASNEAIVNVGDFLAFVGPDDFYTYDGFSVNPIPNALRQWFFRTMNPVFASKIISFYDSSLNIIVWAASSLQANPAGSLDMFIAWNIKTGAWAGWVNTGVVNPIIAFVNSIGQNQALTWGGFGKLYVKWGWGLDGSGHPILVYPGPPLIPPGLLYGDPSFGASPLLLAGVILADGGLYQFMGPPNGRPFIQFGDVGDFEHYIGITRVKPQFSVYPTSGALDSPLGTSPIATRPPPPGTPKVTSPAPATTKPNIDVTPGARLFTFTRDALGSQDQISGPAVLVPTDDAYLNDDESFDIRETARWHQFMIEVYAEAEMNGITIEPTDEGIR